MGVADSRQQVDWFDPRVLRALGRVRLSASRPLSGWNRADRVARRMGASLEFAEHRAYVAGDDPRLLDWNAYARLDRLYTRLYHDEDDMHVCVLVDSSASMRTDFQPDTGKKFNLARQVAAEISHVALAGSLQVSLGFFDSGLVRFSQTLRGIGMFHRALAWLDDAPERAGGTHFDKALAGAAAASPRRSLFVVISDFFDSQPVEESLARVLHRRCDLALVDIHEPIAEAARLAEEWIVVDAETGEERAVPADPEAVREVEGRMAARSEALRRWAVREGVRYARLPVGAGGADVARELIGGGVFVG